jgi:hypothetical protein
MIRNDYIMRLIEQFAVVLTRALGLKNISQLTAALELLRSESGRLIGLDGMMLEMLSPDEIRRALHSPEAGLIAGRVLEEMANIHREQDLPGRAQADNFKALDLYAHILEGEAPRIEDDLREHMTLVMSGLEDAELPWGHRRAFVRYYELTRRFDRAEDLLFDLIDEGFDTASLIGEGLTFYDRLLKLTDDELESGGLPRTEVIDARESLERMRSESGT